MKKYPNQPLVIEKYNPRWIKLYETEKEKIKNKLGSHLLAIEHIGSTAIPGLSAKPIIDIAVVTNSQNDIEECLSLLEELDYEYVDKPEQWYLRKNTGVNTGYHLHLVTSTNSPYWMRATAIKRYLLSHPEIQKEYQNLKEKLFNQFKEDRTQYRLAKGKFMDKLADSALKEYQILDSRTG